MNETYEKLPEEVKAVLRPITEKELLKERIRGRRRIVLKIGEEYYLLSARGTGIDIKYVLGNHLCSKCQMFFGSLCPKVFDPSMHVALEVEPEESIAILKSKRIEKYPFITKGVECFNCYKEYFIVAECSKFRRHRRTE